MKTKWDKIFFAGNLVKAINDKIFSTTSSGLLTDHVTTLFWCNLSCICNPSCTGPPIRVKALCPNEIRKITATKRTLIQSIWSILKVKKSTKKWRETKEISGFLHKATDDENSIKRDCCFIYNHVLLIYCKTIIFIVTRFLLVANYVILWMKIFYSRCEYIYLLPDVWFLWLCKQPPQI